RVCLEALQRHGTTSGRADELFQLVPPVRGDRGVGVERKPVDTGTTRTREPWRLALPAFPVTRPAGLHARCQRKTHLHLLCVYRALSPSCLLRSFDAACINSHTRCGLTGKLVTAIPNGRKASETALGTAA